MYIHIQVTHEPIRVVPRERLTTAPDVAVAIGESPDGLPLVLQIWRDRNVRGPILGVLGRNDSDLPADVSGAIETLQRLVTQQTLAHGLETREGTCGYTSQASIGSMLGASLLAKALGEGGPLGQGSSGARGGHDGGGGGDDLAAITSAGVVMGRDEIKRMIGTAGATRRLFVPVPEGRCRILQVVDPSRTTSPPSSSSSSSPARPIIFERLSRIEGVRFGYAYKDGIWQSGSFEEHGAYRNVVKSADRISWWIPRHALAKILVRIAQSVDEEMHRRGLVHGDLKPANMLVGEDGPVAIDALGIEAGRIATVCTPSWAAPEQVTVRPVTTATDVYALGLVLARILDAVVFGEERTFVVPTGGADKRRMHVLHDPQVFIDPTSGLELSEPAMKAYASFIARCTAFDPSGRPTCGKHFAAELQDLTDRHPLPANREAGWIRLGWLAGTLQRHVDLLGTTQLAWVLSDGRRFS